MPKILACDGFETFTMVNVAIRWAVSYQRLLHICEKRSYHASFMMLNQQITLVLHCVQPLEIDRKAILCKGTNYLFQFSPLLMGFDLLVYGSYLDIISLIIII